MNAQFTKEENQMANKHMEKYSALQVIKEVKIKIFIPFNLAKVFFLSYLEYTVQARGI